MSGSDKDLLLNSVNGIENQVKNMKDELVIMNKRLDNIQKVVNKLSEFIRRLEV